jgi:hypothetical protein
MSERKVVEISAWATTHHETGFVGLYVRCDDDSLWSLYDNQWERLPPIPQTTTGGQDDATD